MTPSTPVSPSATTPASFSPPAPGAAADPSGAEDPSSLFAATLAVVGMQVESGSDSPEKMKKRFLVRRGSP